MLCYVMLYGVPTSLGTIGGSGCLLKGGGALDASILGPPGGGGIAQP